MAVNSRFIKVHPDALIEWIWDDTFFYDNEYSIIKDTLNNTTSFAFNKNQTDSTNYNKIPQQLYLVDSLINKYGIADPDNKLFLQESKYANNQPSLFNKVKIWLPLNFTFINYAGLYLKTYALNYENAVKYNLSNYFLDSTIPSELAKIEIESTPFRYADKLWGKSITIYVPSVYAEANNRTNNAPTVGTINYNLTNGVLGLSQTSSIFIDFRFLTNKITILNETQYLTTPALISALPQAPEYNNVSVNIQESTDGDYFIINGLSNNNLSEFELFMTNLELSGKRSYVLYSITVFEENLPQDTIDIYVYKDFYKPISFRPILKFTNTTASIQVEMKLINSVDASTISKFAEIAIVGNTLAKYGKFLTSINLSNAIKPKLYNSKPEQLILPSKDVILSHMRRKAPKPTVEIKYVPYPVLTNIYNIAIQDLTVINKQNTYYGLGQLEIAISPFDNILKFRILQKFTNSTKAYKIPISGAIIQLVFKSSTSDLRIPLFMESNEVSLSTGVVVFKLMSSQYNTIKTIFKLSPNFYITVTANGVETVIYNGKYVLLEDKNYENLAFIDDSNTETPVNTTNPIRPTIQLNLGDPVTITTSDAQAKIITDQPLSTSQLSKLD